jgi:FkbM family methyltransferase
VSHDIRILPAQTSARLRRSRRVLRRTLRRVGLDVRRYRPRLTGFDGPDFPYRRAQIMNAHGIDLVVDVGAHRGEYGLELRGSGYRGRLVSLEPASEPFAALERAARADGRWECRRAAVGSTAGEARLRIAEISQFSSLRDFEEEAADRRWVGSEVVPVVRLDDVADAVVRGAERVLLKLDVQGSELEALRGGERFLGRVEAVELELSLAPMYEGQALYRDVLDFLHERGFLLVAVDPGYTDATTGYMQQMDAILVRRG